MQHVRLPVSEKISDQFMYNVLIKIHDTTLF